MNREARDLKGLVWGLLTVSGRGLLKTISTWGGICACIYIGVRVGDRECGTLTTSLPTGPIQPVPPGSILTFRLASPRTRYIVPLVWMRPYLALLFKSTPKAGIGGFSKLKKGTCWLPVP